MDRADTLQQLAKLCRGDRDGAPPRSITPTGVSALDAVLPGGGWRTASIVELMPTDVGIGELRLLMPALALITRERHIAFVAPPYVPFAPALEQHGINIARVLMIRALAAKDILWCVEQTLRCRSFGAVLVWPIAISDRDIRRLQLAAESGDSIGFVYRPPEAARESSPAAVRIRLEANTAGALELHVLKCRGVRSGVRIEIHRHACMDAQDVGGSSPMFSAS